MTRRSVPFIVIAAVFPAETFAAGDARSERPAPAGTVHLFNGKNLDGFYRYLRNRGRDNDPQRVFTVHDGMLHVSGREWGCITTVREYDNYRLIAEYKWGAKTYRPRADRARDSGILLHSVGADGAYGGVWMYSIECQLIEGGTGDFIVVGDKSEKFAVTCPAAPERSAGCYVYRPGGERVTIHSGRINWFGRDPAWRDVKGFRGKRDVEKPIGEWNRLEVVADGRTITVVLNGLTVNRSLDTRPHKGRIQIQSEGAEIFFRRLDLIPLRSKASVRE